MKLCTKLQNFPIMHRNESRNYIWIIIYINYISIYIYIDIHIWFFLPFFPKVFIDEDAGFSVPRFDHFKTSNSLYQIPSSFPLYILPYTNLHNSQKASPINVVILCLWLRKLTFHATCLSVIMGFMVSDQQGVPRAGVFPSQFM